jgi:hypothetical protein
MNSGVEINQYQVVEHIGRGGMADVWSARDQRLNRMVAIKTIAHGLSQEADPVSLFKQEAQTIAQMEHPHILPIYDFGEFEGQLYIVMRYVAGGSLDDLLRRGALPLNEVIRLGQAIAQALDYAHSRKVVHLDLKPPNVLLDSHQSPYLADFGLATVLDREGKATNPGSGTLLYMAPEQLTAEVIDHRADIYSFTIVLFHMLSGQLPFEASIPLALKQLQFQEELPEIDAINPALPAYFTDILRQGTAVDPEKRPSDLMTILNELQEALASSTGFGFDMSDAAGVGEEMYELSGDMPESVDAGVLEALDIYSRARHNWAGGNGRFLLGVTHFMLMSGYYRDAEQHGLELDEAGKQMLLRGALEYDHDVDYWWAQLEDNDSRRWVCLHALRSGNAPARVRALYRLETLPDAEKPQIPRLVAQALQVETNEEARIAALQVLGTRARLMKPSPEYGIKTEYHGRMLSTMTRLGIQVTPPAEWQETVYTQEIDLFIAEIALDYSMPRVAEFAARIVGRIRSRIAVRYISQQQQAGRRGALRALALVRDEAPSLPADVSVRGRFYAWWANTLRRMTDQPLHLVSRYTAALVFGWLAMGYHVIAVYRAQALFLQQRWSNAVAVGLTFGMIVGFVVLFSDEFSTRLRQFWPWWARGIASLVLGTLWAVFAWWAFQWLFLYLQPGMEIIVFGGVGMAFGFVLTALFRLRSWLAVPITAVSIYIPIYVTFVTGWLREPLLRRVVPLEFDQLAHSFFGLDWLGQQTWTVAFQEALLIYDFDLRDQIISVGLPFAVLIAIGGHLPAIIRDVRGLVRRLRPAAADQPAQIPVAAPPEITPAGAEGAPQPDAGEVHTERDVNVAGAADDEAKTELDAVLGRKDDEAQSSTDLDPGQGGIRAPADDERPTARMGTDSERVDIGTGIRVSQERPSTDTVRLDDPPGSDSTAEDNQEDDGDDKKEGGEQP